MLLALAAAFVLAFPLSGTALANMPVLTARPSPATLEACQAWAAKQGEDARDMWGVLPSGDNVEAVGILRLTLSCLGDPSPEFVGVGSSAGYDATFCRKHPKTPLCGKVRR